MIRTPASTSCVLHAQKLTLAMDYDYTIILGQRCKDGGTCHHSCSQAQGCFRQQGCFPLTSSGLDDSWRSPQEVATIEAEELAKNSRKTRKRSTIRTL